MQHGVSMVGTWKELLDFVWWAFTGREARPRFRLSLRPGHSAVAAVLWAWASALLLLSALIVTGDANRPVPSWVFAVIGTVALLWAPTRYALFVDGRRIRRLALIALAIGAPVFFLPVPPDVELLATHRVALWALMGIGTALAAPLLAFPLRLLRSGTSPSVRGQR
jgi:hypothetical protein